MTSVDPRPRREDKLLLFAAWATFAVRAGTALLGPGESRWLRIGASLPFLLYPALHLGIRRTRPSWALALVLLPWLVCARVAWSSRVPSRGGEWAAALADAGLLSVGAAALLLAVPAAYFLDAVRHEHRPVRVPGLAGLSLVGGTLALSPFAAVFHHVPLAVCYLLPLSLAYRFVEQRKREHYALPVRREQSLSVIVITKNEADRIARCLESVHGWADEIVVLDSGSTDGTLEIARRYATTTRVTDWPGFGPQKQRALALATRDWVLSIDADEELTPDLRHDIDRVLGREPDYEGYRLPWGVIVYGKLLDFGRSARAPLRLFRREGSRFTDAQVHETVVLPPGRVGRLRGRLLHYTQRDFGHALEKVARYGWLGAQQRHARGQRAGGLLGAAARGTIVFLQVYVIRLGFLDGGPGFLVAALYGQVAFDKYAGLWALRREARSAQRQR